VFLALREGPPQSFREESWEVQAQLGLLGLLIAGYVVAWRWEWLGGAILVVGSVVLGVLAAIVLDPTMAVIPCLAFFLPGSLYLYHWQSRAGAWHILGLGVALAAVFATGGVAAARVYEYYTGPTHPYSDRVLPPVDLVEWSWAGATTDTSFTVKALLADGLEAPVLLVSKAEDLSNPIAIRAGTVGSAEYELAEFKATDLEPGTRYFYAVSDRERIDDGRRGAIRTFPSGPASFTIAVGSCARVGSNGLVYEAIREANPLLFIATGDFHYSNISTNDIDRFREAYRKQIGQSAQQALYLSTSIAYVWDDHDFGGDGSNRTAKAGPAALAAYRENVPHYPLALEGAQAPIGQAFTLGRVRFIMTDGRAARDPRDGEGVRSAIGAEQKEWFKNELLAANGKYPLIVWVNAIPWIAAASPSADHWGAFPEERAEIAEFVAANGIEGLMILSGDAHMLAIDDGSNSSYAEGVDQGPVVFHAAALDRLGSKRGGPYSEGAFPGGGQFGLMQVEDSGSELTVHLSGRNYLGEEKVAYSFTVPGASVQAGYAGGN
jgi:hypothetical protein